MDSCNIIFSTVVCGTCVVDPDTFIASEDSLGVFGEGNPPCNAEDNLRTGHIVIEGLVRGLLRESWIKGSSAVRTIDIGRTNGM